MELALSLADIRCEKRHCKVRMQEDRISSPLTTWWIAKHGRLETGRQAKGASTHRLTAGGYPNFRNALQSRYPKKSS
uniref:Uncharacterized protein n=1 Tax=Trichuris muris TaxID=70415 RepID=A0A5S6QGE5_TRIMR